MYLADTNVLSALAPGRRVPEPVAAWVEAQTGALFLSVMTITEIEDGIAKAGREGATRKAANLTAWMESLLHLYAPRILPFGIGAARLAGRLSDRARGQGQAPGYADMIIAATAQHHGLTVLTRNVRHFIPLGISVLNPLE